MQVFDKTIEVDLDERLEKLEDYFNSDVIFYYGSIHPADVKSFRDFIENLKEDGSDKNRLTIILNTPGGDTETVEKLVTIIRYHYNEVYFVVPDFAMSAGTIFCMSGDKIYMDYSSSLGPIDPQKFINEQWIAVLGYLDKVNELIKKSKDGKLTNAEFLMLQKQDLAILNSYEQARELTITLLKEWLVNYKFKDWNTHHTDPKKIGKHVSLEEKQKRAEEISKKLGDNKLWHSHGRMIGINTLKNQLRLKIDDYSNNIELRELIRSYNDLICDYIATKKYFVILHSRKNFLRI